MAFAISHKLAIESGGNCCYGAVHIDAKMGEKSYRGTVINCSQPQFCLEFEYK